MGNKKVHKSSIIFNCKLCNYNTVRESQYIRHLNTAKHEMVTNDNNSGSIKFHSLICSNCSKEFKHRSGLSRHKQKCQYRSIDDPLHNSFVKQNNPDMIQTMVELIKQNQEFKQLLVEQNHTIIELSSKPTTNNNTTNNNNNNNQKFNLNFFLNDTCKDAMNMSDFIENMNVQFEDIENIGRNGYVAGMTDLILSRIKNLDVTKRPMHCTDMKRETIYIKDNDVWEKDANNAKLHKMIGCIAHQNYGIIPAWRDKYPDSTNAETPKFEFCITMMRNVLGDAGDEQTRLDNKVIRNVTKHINVDKQPDTMET